MTKNKALEDYSEDEVARLFIEDCLVPPISTQMVPGSVIDQLLKAYCNQVGLKAPTKVKLTNLLRKYYTSTTKDGQTYYRAAIRPGLL